MPILCNFDLKLSASCQALKRAGRQTVGKEKGHAKRSSKEKRLMVRNCTICKLYTDRVCMCQRLREMRVRQRESDRELAGSEQM